MKKRQISTLYINKPKPSLVSIFDSFFIDLMNDIADSYYLETCIKLNKNNEWLNCETENTIKGHWVYTYCLNDNFVRENSV